MPGQGRMFRYRTAKKIYKAAKRGSVSPGTAQYLGRRAWGLSRTMPGGNYANPKRSR